jgi:thiamine-monophosphate kinase
MNLADVGERGIIEKLAAGCDAGRDVVLGIGDDAAVVNAGNYDFVLTSDPVIEGVHFAAGTDPRRVGHKATGRVLSDVAAMGAEPLWLLVNLVAPPSLEETVLQEVYAGAGELLRGFGAAIIGGDVAQGETLELHVFGVGRLPRGTALFRSAAREGDRVYVTGELGGSIRGKHLDFMPRVSEGIWLRAGGWARAMIDVSDGLVSELYHLARCSGVDVVLRADDVPVSSSARDMKDDRSALQHALCDGEDFELLFTVPEEKAAAFENAWQAQYELACTCIGYVGPGSGRIRDVDGRDWAAACGGFEHFSTQALFQDKRGHS